MMRTLKFEEVQKRVVTSLVARTSSRGWAKSLWLKVRCGDGVVRYILTITDEPDKKFCSLGEAVVAYNEA